MVLSKMQGNQQFRAVLILFAFSGLLLAQSSAEIAQLYTEGNIEELRNLRDQNAIKDPDWQNFVENLFVMDAEIATQNMLVIYANTRDPQLRRIIRQRTADFYSARGYYETSQRLLRDDAFVEQLASIAVNRAKQSSTQSGTTNSPQQPVMNKREKFAIQVGAFSTLQNARRATQTIRRYYPTARILEKEREGSPLFVVVIGEFSSKSQAETLLPDIQEKLNLQGYIIGF
jgi:hypothetical protein